MSKMGEFLESCFDLAKSPERLSIMMVLTGAHVLYDEWGITTHYGIDKTIKLDERGKYLLERMREEESIDYSKLEGHYEVIETEERFREIIQEKNNS